MPKLYHHLTGEQRCQIEALKRSRMSNAAIARQLGVDRATIGREITRNRARGGYRGRTACKKATARRACASAAPRKMTSALLALIKEKLTREQWSPDQISGWIAREGKGDINPETIYRHIWADKKKGGTLHTHLRHGGKKYNRRKGKHTWRGIIPGRIDIDRRPAVVNEKSRIGDWEGDTIAGSNHQSALLSHVERKSKFTRLHKLHAATAPNTTAATVHDLRRDSDKVLTITYDNGKEFAGHDRIAEILHADVFFAKPYHAWERGLNEHTNGLVRQYFPKGTDFATVSDEEIATVEKKLNNRPRKVLAYATPCEVFKPAVTNT
jgi:transposase, IS30 family